MWYNIFQWSRRATLLARNITSIFELFTLLEGLDKVRSGLAMLSPSIMWTICKFYNDFKFLGTRINEHDIEDKSIPLAWKIVFW